MERATAAVALVGGLGAVSSCLAQTFAGLGDLPGGDIYSVATSVSPNGFFAVGCSHGFGGAQAFLWSRWTGMLPLGDLSGGAYSSCAFGVADDGLTVVGEATSASGPVAFRWTLSGGLKPLSSSGSRGPSIALAVSRDGRVIVGQAGPPGEHRAFRCTAGSGLTVLPDPPGGAVTASARGVSFDGRTIVGSGAGPLGYEAVRWTIGPLTTRAGSIESLGELPGGKYSGTGWAVSGDGAVVVGGSIAMEDDTEAFRWAGHTGMVGLGDLPGGLFDSFAHAASEHGDVIVGRAWGPTGLSAFVWTPAAGMRALREMLVAKGVNLSGWTLSVAHGISADGRTIVGMGSHHGETEAWIATIPPYCPPDCNADGALTASDLACFQQRFMQGDLLYADCNDDGQLNVLDWSCFQAKFLAGCTQAAG